jgi:hypothetical protein
MGKWGCREGLVGCLKAEGWGELWASDAWAAEVVPVGSRWMLILGLHLATVPYSGKTTVDKRFHND